MAEAAEPSAENNYHFCHTCCREILPKLPEYVCPVCNLGFIELVDHADNSDSDTSSDAEASMYIRLITGDSEPPSSSGGSRSNTSGRRRQHRLRRAPSSTLSSWTRSNPLGPFLESFLGPNVIAQTDMNMLPLGIGVSSIPLMGAPNLVANPGDYAWGRGGLDTIITQLMNQIEGAGAAPLPEDKIKQIPTVNINQEHCDKKLQCPVCFDDYVLGEPVRQLSCEHIFHENCILPWLQLHGTCPVCRQELSKDNAEQPQTNNNTSTTETETSGDDQVVQGVVLRFSPNGQFILAPPSFTEEELD